MEQRADGRRRHLVAAVSGPVAAAAALTVVMNIIAGLLVARLYDYGPEHAADIATTLVARGEFALLLAAMAATAGLDARLAPFIAGYVLVLAVLGPVVAGRAHLPARALIALGSTRTPGAGRRLWGSGTRKNAGGSDGGGQPRSASPV